MAFNIPDKDNPVQYHFVVTYDCEAARFILDYETASSVFHEGVVFDKSTDEWRHLHGGELGNDGTLYNVAGDALFNTLMSDLNNRWKV